MLGAICTTALTSCDDNWEYPPLVVPEATAKANTTIADLKSEFFQGTTYNYSITVGEKADGSHYIIEGTVTSSDESGNIFKKVYIEDNTGGIYIGIDAYDLYQSYKEGQKVVVDVTGLAIGGYGGAMNIGLLNATGAPNRIDEATAAKHIQVDGMPSAETMVEPMVINLDELPASPLTNEGLAFQNRLVRINGVTFENAGRQTLSTSGSSGVSQSFGTSTRKIVLYTSGYSDFWDYYCPVGTGDVIGILSCYGTTWQMVLNDIEGLVDFEELSKDPAPEKPVEAVASFSVDFEDGNLPEGWTQVQAAGDKAWYVTSFSNNYYASMTGYKGTAPFDQWLISAPVNMDAATVKNLSFVTEVNGYGSTTSALEVYIVTDPTKPGDTCTKLSPTLATSPASGYSDWTPSGTIDLSAFSGTVYVAFRYTATTDANYATWCVDNINVNIKN